MLFLFLWLLFEIIMAKFKCTFLVLWRYKWGGVWLFGSLDLKERGNILKIRLLIGLNK